MSRLVPRKGMDVLIEAAGRLAPSYPDLVVAIAGRRARARAACGAWPRASPVDRGACSAGSATRTGPACSAPADVFVMACRNRWLGLEQEGFGIVFLEAAAAGVPQIAGDSGGAAEAVLDGVTGLVVRRPRGPGGGGRGPAHPAGRPGPAPAHGPGRPGPGAGILRLTTFSLLGWPMPWPEWQSDAPPGG